MSTQHEHHAQTIDESARQDPPLSPVRASQGAQERYDIPHTGSPAAERGVAVMRVAVPSETTVPHALPAPASASSQRAGVHVAPNLRDLITAAPLATPQEAQAAKQRRDLNAVVHSVLILGLIISTVFMLAGVALDLFYQRELPTAVPDIGEVVSRVLALQPSGFLALGLLVLIATPILRVIGSIGAFLYERDWRFAGVTTLVLIILSVSMLLGRG
jgi:uncharacterized membrane protein